MHSCLYTKPRALPGWCLKQVYTSNFLTRIQNPEMVDLDIIWLFEVRTCVFAMLKTVRLEGGLSECSLKSKLIELSYWRSLFSLKSK